MLTGTDFALAGLAGCAAGAVNAIAGGGTLISFPTLIALGIPEVTANVTNTVALVPGLIGGLFAQKKDLAGQGRYLRLLIPAGILGGLAGGILLVLVSPEFFHILVPFLILLAAFLLAVQDRAREWILARLAKDNTGERRALVPVGLSAVYGGFFGAGLGVILLAVLGLFISEPLTRLNALKQALSFSANIAAAVFFLFSGLVLWPVAAVMAAGALTGGFLGGRLAGSVKPSVLRWAVVAIGTVIGVTLLVQQWGIPG
jgi:uncharacterized protein